MFCNIFHQDGDELVLHISEQTGRVVGLEGRERTIGEVFLLIGGVLVVHADGERELHKLTAASDTTKLVGIVSTPELDSTALVNTSDLSEFYNKAGRACRVHILHDGDQFSLSAEGFVTVPTLNGTVGITNGKWDSAAQTALLTCDEISVVGGVTMYLLTVSADKLNQ